MYRSIRQNPTIIIAYIDLFSPTHQDSWGPNGCGLATSVKAEEIDLADLIFRNLLYYKYLSGVDETPTHDEKEL